MTTCITSQYNIANTDVVPSVTNHQESGVCGSNNNNNSTSNKKMDPKYITCSHVQSDWGKDFAGTSESVVLCTPPWEVLREALFGIVQSLKDDDNNNINRDDDTDQHSKEAKQQQQGGAASSSSQQPVDIAYVVVVNASARIKKTPQRIPKRKSLLGSITPETSTVAAVNVQKDQRDHDTIRNMDMTHVPPPKYKLLIGDHSDDHQQIASEKENEAGDEHNRALAVSTPTIPSLFTTGNRKLPHQPPGPSLLLSSSIDSQLSQQNQPESATETTNNRPKFRLMFD